MSRWPAIKTIRDLKIYEIAYRLAIEIFNVTKTFPKEETYSLVDQLRRSSRSVASNIREGYAKRRYEHVFVRHLNDALGSCEESRTWLEFGADAGYITKDARVRLDQQYDELSAMLYRLMDTWHGIEEPLSDLRPQTSDL